MATEPLQPPALIRPNSVVLKPLILLVPTEAGMKYPHFFNPVPAKFDHDFLKWLFQLIPPLIHSIANEIKGEIVLEGQKPRTFQTTIGVDVSDRTSKVCVMAKTGGERRVLVETTCATAKDGFSECFAKFDRSWPVVFETGTHCRWMKWHFEGRGFHPIVGNPAKAKAAVARGLAVQVVALLKHPEREYVPLSEEGRKGFER